MHVLDGGDPFNRGLPSEGQTAVIQELFLPADAGFELVHDLIVICLFMLPQHEIPLLAEDVIDLLPSNLRPEMLGLLPAVRILHILLVCIMIVIHSEIPKIAGF